jgi:MerR family copper efflux transcriptional regulator
MNIGHAAEASGLPAKTIRYYEEVGLVSPARRGNGYRDYDTADLHKLRFLARARGLGFTLEDCRALLTLWEDQGRASADVKALAQEHLTAVDRKISELRTLQSTLEHLVHACQGDHRPDCPIIDELAGR